MVMVKTDAAAMFTQSHGEARTVRIPARRSATSDDVSSDLEGERVNPRSGRRHSDEIINDRASSPNASEVPPRATMIPPRAGAATPVISLLRDVSELALGRTSRGTRSGNAAL